jgi:hypothetical protein
MRDRSHARLILLACLLLMPARTHAGEPTLQVTEENDVFCGCGLDRHYTQGLRVSFESSRDPQRVRWTLGQTIYTPGDLGRSDLVYGDRPYSGWLWFGPELVRETGSRRRSARFYVGATGEASFAEEAQRWVHRVIGAPDPQGWDHQLRAQLGANLFLDEQHLIPLVRPGRWLQADLMPRATLAVGNIFDHVEAGAQLRLGRLDSAPWGEPPIPSYRVADPAAGGRSPWEPVEAYVVTTLTGRAAAYDYSLQGDHARERFGIRPLPLVGTWEVGLGLALWRAKVEFRWVVRSADFDPLREPQGYGSLRLGMR